MNSVVLVGRLGADPELKYTPDGAPVASFRLAVDRQSKDGGCDWIQCVAWRQSAEFAANYLHKGDRVGVRGRIQVRQWTTQDGSKRWSTEIVADRVESYAAKREQAESAPHDPDTDDPFGEE